MKRFFKITTIIIAVSIIGFMIAFAASGFDTDLFPNVFYANADSDFTEMGKELSVEDVSKISVTGSSEKVFITNTDSDTLSVKYFESDYKVTEVSEQNGEISIKSIREKSFWFNFKTQSSKTDYIQLTLPKSFAGELNIKTSSGDIKFNGTNTLSAASFVTSSDEVLVSGITVLGASEFRSSSDDIELTNCDLSGGKSEIKTSSGSIDIKNCTFSAATAKSSSDDIEIQNSTFTTLEISNKSGRIELKNVTADSITVKTSSDNVEFKNVTADSIDAQSSSGKVDMANITATTLYAKTSSDNISLTDISADSITAKTSSGKITMTINGSFEDYKTDVKTSSGKITIDGAKYYSNIYNTTAEKYLYAHTSSDNVSITFK